MNQLLNLLSFAMELVFGRDASMRRSRSQTIRHLIVIAVLAASFLTHYYMIKSLYSATAKYIAVKEQLNDYEALKVRLQYLELHNTALTNVMKSIAPGILLPVMPEPPKPTPPPVPPVAPTVPALPSRDDHHVTDKNERKAT